jgi:hypothetical protein
MLMLADGTVSGMRFAHDGVELGGPLDWHCGGFDAVMLVSTIQKNVYVREYILSWRWCVVVTVGRGSVYGKGQSEKRVGSE